MVYEAQLLAWSINNCRDFMFGTRAFHSHDGLLAVANLFWIDQAHFTWCFARARLGGFKYSLNKEVEAWTPWIAPAGTVLQRCPLQAKSPLCPALAQILLLSVLSGVPWACSCVLPRALLMWQWRSRKHPSPSAWPQKLVQGATLPLSPCAGM